MTRTLSAKASAAAGLGLVLLLFTPAARADCAAAAPLELFEALRARVAAAVGEGALPTETATAADELAFDLERELIRHDAEIQVLRLEVARYDGEAQQQALDRLVAAVVAKERAVSGELLLLESLAQMSRCAELGAPAPPGLETPPIAASAEGQAEAEPGRDERSRWSITFEAQDLTEDPDS